MMLLVTLAVIGILLTPAPPQESTYGRTEFVVAGRRVEAQSRRHSGRLYLRLRDLRPLGLVLAEADSGRLRVAGPAGAVTLRSGSSLVREQGRMTLLSAPVRRWDGEWFVPEDFVDRIAVSVLEARGRPRARPDRPRPQVRESGSVRLRVLSDRVEIRLRTGSRFEISQEEGWLGVTLDADTVSGRLPAVPPNPIVAAIVPVPDGSKVELRLVTGPAFTRFERSSSPSYQTIVLHGDPTRISPMEPGPSEDPDARIATLGRQPSCSVVLDAGHGGEDRGLAGSGIVEKDLALTLARQVQSRLRQSGRCARLVRSRDTGIGLEQRSAAANNLSPAVFVSLHAVFGSNPIAYIHPSRSAGDRADGRMRRWEQAQQSHTAASRRLASGLLEALQGRLLVSAPIAVLAPVDAPAVLLEVPFASGQDPSGAAAAIAAAIERFLGDPGGAGPQ